MKKLSYGLLIVAALALFTSCEEDSDLSTSEVVEGLKTALKVGTDSSTTALSVVNGYYGDELVKVPLPDEVENIRSELNELKKKNSILGDYFSSVTEPLFEDVVVGVNKAAESAADEAGPIFGESIDELSIGDAWDILNGTNPADTSKRKSAGFDSTAATQYFKTTTKGSLIDLYAPKIDHFLDQPLIKKKSGMAITPNSAFSTLKTEYNNAFDLLQDAIDTEAATAGLFGVTPIADEFNKTSLTRINTPTIGTFCTDKALDGLFFMVGKEERKIRRDPWAWISDIASQVGEILVKVFGS